MMPRSERKSFQDYFVQVLFFRESTTRRIFVSFQALLGSHFDDASVAPGFGDEQPGEPLGPEAGLEQQHTHQEGQLGNPTLPVTHKNPR